MADISISPRAAQLRLASRRAQVANLSDLTNATSGIARSGVTRSGYTSASVTTFDPFLDITIDDDLRGQHIDDEQLSIVLGLNSEPSTLTARIVPRGQFEVRRGQQIQVWQGGVGTGVPLFAGHMLSVEQQINRVAHEIEYVVEAVDYRWLLDRFSLVTKTYRKKGVNAIVADLLTNFTDSASGFVPGYLPSGLGTVNYIQFTNRRVTECLQQLAETVDGGALWHVDERKHVHIFAEPADEGNAITVDDSGDWRHLVCAEDLTVVVNRVIFLGGGSKTTASIAVGATTIGVEEVGWYNPAGGTVQAPSEAVTYTGISTGSGPGDLTGVSGVTEDIPQGTTLHNRAQADDTAAQTALAADLGDSQSGVSVHRSSDLRLGYERTAEAAEALLDTLSTPNIRVSYDIVPSAATPEDQLTYIRPGRLASMAVTAPVAIAGSFRVRQVSLVPWSRSTAGDIVFARSVEASRVRHDVLRTALQEGIR